MLRDFAFVDVIALLEAMRWTLLLSLLAFVGGGLAGMGITLLRVSRSAMLRRVAQGYILFVQGTPLLMQMFLVYFGLALCGLDIPPVLAAALRSRCMRARSSRKSGAAPSSRSRASNGRHRRHWR